MDFAAGATGSVAAAADDVLFLLRCLELVLDEETLLESAASASKSIAWLDCSAAALACCASNTSAELKFRADDDDADEEVGIEDEEDEVLILADALIGVSCLSCCSLSSVS